MYNVPVLQSVGQVVVCLYVLRCSDLGLTRHIKIQQIDSLTLIGMTSLKSKGLKSKFLKSSSLQRKDSGKLSYGNFNFYFIVVVTVLLSAPLVISFLRYCAESMGLESLQLRKSKQLEPVRLESEMNAKQEKEEVKEVEKEEVVEEEKEVETQQTKENTFASTIMDEKIARKK